MKSVLVVVSFWVGSAASAAFVPRHPGASSRALLVPRVALPFPTSSSSSSSTRGGAAALNLFDPPTAWVCEALGDLELSQDAIVAGAVVLLGLAGVALSSQQGSGSSSSEPTAPSKQQAAAVNVPPPPDLSIPYDAAARLAFAEWKGTNEATYAKFQPLYEAKAVAEATAKKVARDALHEEKRYTDIAGQAVKDIEALLAA